MRRGVGGWRNAPGSNRRTGRCGYPCSNTFAEWRIAGLARIGRAGRVLARGSRDGGAQPDAVGGARGGQIGDM